jgi:hypothetical protein
MGSLHFSLTEEPDRSRIYFSGGIDEDTDFRGLTPASQVLFLDLDGIKVINSTGIRKWISWIKLQMDKTIVLAHCPRIFIDQLNMVAGFLPNGAKVQTFYVPYYSDSTGSEKNVIFQVGKEVIDGQVKHFPQVTGEDGKEMQLDVHPEKYFKFLKSFT